MAGAADAVVIGGGVVGCAIAYNLAKQGVGKVVLLEKGYLASGATGRCGAGVRMQWGTRANCPPVPGKRPDVRDNCRAAGNAGGH